MLTVISLAIALYTLTTLRKASLDVVLSSAVALLTFSAFVVTIGVLPATGFLAFGLSAIWIMELAKRTRRVVWQAPNGTTFAFAIAP